MSGAQLAEFPLDDAVARMTMLREHLPRIAAELLRFQRQVAIGQSHNAAEDRELMRRTDRFVEEKLLSAITDLFVRDAIFSEEAGRAGGEGEFQWWIDPVDGTRNFIHGVPAFCMAVGVCFRGTPILGAVYLPTADMLYHAIRGGGAFRDQEPIHVSGVATLDRALIASGLPYARSDVLPILMANISAFVAAGSGMRRSGSSVLDLCWTAEGRFDCMWERGVSPFDTCGASVIVAEAGGKVSNFAGETFDFEFPEIVAGNPHIHSAAVDALRAARTVEGVN